MPKMRWLTSTVHVLCHNTAFLKFIKPWLPGKSYLAAAIYL